MSYTGIPVELRERRQWVAYRAVASRSRPGKTDKIPVNPSSGTNASSTDPATWGTFGAAVARAKRDQLAGIGFVFTGDDPYIGVDFDHVRDTEGNLEQWALDYLRLIGSYAEISPSGTGLHIIARGRLPPGGRKAKQVEVYDSGRFFTFTGNTLPGYESIRDAQREIDLMHREQFEHAQPKQKPDPIRQPAQPVKLADDDLLARARGASNGSRFSALWAGNWAGYPSQSEGDLALCSLLAFWTGGDAQRVDDFFRRSGLFRDKWDAPHYADGATYGQATIAKALAGTTEYYRGKGHEPQILSLAVPDVAEPPGWYDDECAGLDEVSTATAKQPEARETITVARQPLQPEPKADLSECPPLPETAHLDPTLHVAASPWLDGYRDFSRLWAPRAYEGFHESVALWVLSTVAARRVRVDLGGERFTNLYFANVARSSVWTKSTAHKIGSEMIEAAGLRHLLAPDDATPQALLHRMGRQGVSSWETLSPEDQELTRLRMAFAGQRGWDFDEFGHKVAAMMRDLGPMADFRGILRKLDDCPKSYEYLTITRGSVLLDRPYLSLLGSMTPADMRPYAKPGGALWGDGFWARFAFVAPPPEEGPIMGRFPTGQRTIPPSILTPLRDWHNRLGAPQVEVVECSETDDSGKPKPKKWDVRVGPAPVQLCVLGAGVFDAFYNYHDALVTLAQANDNPDLDGNYSRFAEKALRVAALLGSLENGGLIRLEHWARAQVIAERWRQSLHNLYRTLNAAQTEEAEQEERILEIMNRQGTFTPTDIHRAARQISTTDAADILSKLERAGAIRLVKETRKGTGEYQLAEWCRD